MAAINQLPPPRRRGLNLKPSQRETVAFYIFILPWLLGFVIFTLGPMLASAYLSLTEFSIMSPPKWVGLLNFQQMFQTKLFWQSMYNTLYMVALDLPLGLVAALGAALLLNQKLRGVNVFRSIFYLPVLIPAIANILLWVWIFDKDAGILNTIIKSVGLPPQPWLTSEIWSKPSLIFMNLWAVGGAMLIFLAGLKGIPQELHEAAKIDGASAWQAFWKITLPLLSPTILFMLVIGVIGEFQIFTQGYILGGGPNFSTTFYVLLLFNNAFRYLKMGYASAMAWVLFAITLVITLAVFRSTPYWVYYESERRR
ncbi:MAG: sugar ABC transporter permease [Chloroflexi bacterium]|nr:MAG: sugar ABC transporter permease [Chloroflexota bacterium]